MAWAKNTNENPIFKNHIKYIVSSNMNQRSRQPEVVFVTSVRFLKYAFSQTKILDKPVHLIISLVFGFAPDSEYLLNTINKCKY